MQLLKFTLALKIFLTVCWAASLLFLSKAQFRKLGIAEPQPIVFTRLLGAAFLALLVGYALGLREIYQGEVPSNTIFVGVVSNGLACLILIYFGLKKMWSEWGRMARYSMWASAALTGLITMLLVLSFYIIRHS
jgi:hypothetical protein